MACTLPACTSHQLQVLLQLQVSQRSQGSTRARLYSLSPQPAAIGANYQSIVRIAPIVPACATVPSAVPTKVELFLASRAVSSLQLQAPDTRLRRM